MEREIKLMILNAGNGHLNLRLRENVGLPHYKMRLFWFSYADMQIGG